MNQIIGVIIIIFILCSSLTQILLRAETRDTIIAAIKDSGCSSHPHRVIEQSNKQIKDTYVKWGG